LLKLPANYSIVREGKSNGENWVFRIITSTGREISAVAVTQPNKSRTGPTWSYVFENIGLNSVDVGSPGSFESLKDGYKAAGIDLADVTNVIVTHGHSDHDGTIPEFLKESGSRLFAHESYDLLKAHRSWDIQDFSATVLKRELSALGEKMIDKDTVNQRVKSDGEYYHLRKSTKVNSNLSHGDNIGDMKVLSTPGHSPDQICLEIDNILFTGDHVLPEITPHPTSKMVFKNSVNLDIKASKSDLESLYGLGVYLESLGVVTRFAKDTVLLPAHRLYNRGNLNEVDPSRAKDIIDHHSRRLARLLKSIGSGESSLEDITEGIFSRGKLLGGNLMAAVSEVVAHLEFLDDTEDIKVGNDGSISLISGAHHNYTQTIERMLS